MKPRLPVHSSSDTSHQTGEVPAVGPQPSPWRAALELLIQQVRATQQEGTSAVDRQYGVNALLQLLALPVDPQDLAYGCQQLNVLGEALLLEFQRPTEAEAIMTRCCELLEHAGREHTLLRIQAMRRLATAYIRELRPCEVIDLTLRAQSLLEHLSDPGEEPLYLQTLLGVGLQLAGYLSEAERRFLAVLADAQTRPPRPKDSPLAPWELVASSCQGNLALLNLHRGDCEKAVQLAHQALVDLEARGKQAHTYTEWRWSRCTVLCEALVRLGRTDEAQAQVSGMLASEEGVPGLRYSVHRELACGMADVAGGRRFLGFRRLHRVLAESRSRRYVVHAALRLLIAAYEWVGDSERALKHIQELTQLMVTMSQNLALAVASGQAMRDDTLVFILSERAAKSRVNALLQMANAHPVPSLRRLAQATSLVDDETGNHCGRVGRLVFFLARELGHSQEGAQLFADAAQLHDIGKSGINHQILLKPGPLSPTEKAVIQRHVDIGAAILGRVDHPVAALASIAAMSHHECWNGTGYPNGLAGQAIPEVARLTAVADVYDVMRTRRCYKPSIGRAQTFAEIRRCAGTQFDPKMVEAFLRLPDAAFAEVEGEYHLV